MNCRPVQESLQKYGDGIKRGKSNRLRNKNVIKHVLVSQVTMVAYRQKMLPQPSRTKRQVHLHVHRPEAVVYHHDEGHLLSRSHQSFPSHHLLMLSMEEAQWPPALDGFEAPSPPESAPSRSLFRATPLYDITTYLPQTPLKSQQIQKNTEKGSTLLHFPSIDHSTAFTSSHHHPHTTASHPPPSQQTTHPQIPTFSGNHPTNSLVLCYENAINSIK